MSIQLFPIQRARPGFSTSYILVYQNNGTVPITNATIELVLDSRLTFASSSPSPLTVAGDTLKWTLSNLIPDSIGLITIVFGIPASPSVNIGDTLSSVATIYPTVGDSTPVDNTVQLHQRVLGSFDPNDKSEIHGGAITTSKVAEGEYLQYTIRFQNTGTDTAFRIIIEDTLSDKLDWSTLQMVSASHDYKLTISGGKNCKWNFVNIKLVDSMENAALSHGYVVYRIKPKANLVIGNVIRNTAFIYFDYNPPIKTNTEVTTVTQSALPLKLQIFSARKSGTKNLLEWTTSNEDDVEYFEVQRSMEGRDFKAIGKVLAKGMSIVQHYFFTDYEPLKTVNFYRLKMIDRDGNFTFSPIRKINSQLVFDVNVYPNPVKNNLYIYTTCEWSTNVIIDIVNAEGKIVMQQKMTLAEGADVKTLNIASLATGNYFIKFRNGNELISVKFQKL